MDDYTLARISQLESTVSDIRAQVSTLLGTIPHLATKADVTAPTSYATRSSIIRWTVGWALAAAACMICVAKFIH